MVKFSLFFKLLVFVLLCTFSTAFVQTVEATDENTIIKFSTDKEIYSGKTFNFRVTVITNVKLNNGSLQYDHLSSNFTVGHLKFSQAKYDQDPALTVYKWDIPLLTNNSGIIEIKPFTIKGLGKKSSPVTIQVKQPTSKTLAKKFIKTLLRNPTAIEGQLVMYRVETDILPNVKIQSYTPPKAENATIELYQEKVTSRVSKENSISQPSYKTQIREYKIIFHKAGENVIKGPVIQGIIKTPGGTSKTFDQEGEQQKINIKPNPNNDLVSDNITIAVQWTPDEKEVSVGQAITRSITIRGTNNALSQFPSMELPEMPDYDVYVEKTKESEKLMKNKKLISTLIVKQVFVPKKNHTTFNVSDVKFTWLNPNDGKKKDLTIDGATYEVSGFSFNDYIPRDPRYAHWLFAGVAFLLVFGVFTYYSIIWYRERVGIYGRLHKYMDFRGYWKQMRKSWSKKDPFQTRNAIIEWAQKRWEGTTIVGLSDIPFYKENKVAFDNLSAACWAPDHTAWDDSEIRKVISKNRNYRRPKAKHGINPYGLNGEMYETVTQKLK
jgi:hypothetical protein